MFLLLLSPLIISSWFLTSSLLLSVTVLVTASFAAFRGRFELVTDDDLAAEVDVEGSVWGSGSLETGGNSFSIYLTTLSALYESESDPGPLSSSESYILSSSFPFVYARFLSLFLCFFFFFLVLSLFLLVFLLLRFSSVSWSCVTASFAGFWRRFDSKIFLVQT